MKKFRKLVSLLLVLVLMGSTASLAMASEEKIIIAVATYSTTDQEVLAFKKYYVDYLADAFNVEFLYSEGIMDGEAEIAFVEKAAAAGAKGIIAFVSTDLEMLVDKCESNELFLVMGAGMVKDELVATVIDNPWYLGCTGPTMDAETEAGKAMANAFIDRDTENKFNYVIVSGGGAMGNDMHAERTRAMLMTLEERLGAKLPEDASAYTRLTEATELELAGHKILIYPSYPMSDAWFAGFAQYMMTGEYDVVMSTMGSGAVATLVDEAEKTFGKNILVGAVDCFTEDNKIFFNTLDSTGDIQLNFLAGKYGSLVGCAFAAMYNAITGNSDMLREEGNKGFALYQGFWTATSQEEYNANYELATNPDTIAYSVDDLKTIIKVFNPDATFEDFKALTNAYTVEDVKARRGL